jgi:hypothetical protein
VRHEAGCPRLGSARAGILIWYTFAACLEDRAFPERQRRSFHHLQLLSSAAEHTQVTSKGAERVSRGKVLTIVTSAAIVGAVIPAVFIPTRLSLGGFFLITFCAIVIVDIAALIGWRRNARTKDTNNASRSRESLVLTCIFFGLLIVFLFFFKRL